MSKIVAIVGPTASGKTRLAVALAHRFDGEIVSADSMQIYRGMNIGTAKPTLEEQEGVPHHMISIAGPDEEFTLKRYLDLANTAVQEILSRGKTVIVTGGTALYWTALLDGICLAEETADPALRESLCVRYDADGGSCLMEELCRLDPETAARLHVHDRKRVIRALEVFYATGRTLTEQNQRSRPAKPQYESLILGLNFRNREELYRRIDLRVEQMLAQGLEQEVRALDLHHCSRTARQAIGYAQFLDYLDGTVDLARTVERIKMESRRYAKRQLTWLRRDSRIVWFYPDVMDFNNILNNCGKSIANFLNV